MASIEQNRRWTRSMTNKQNVEYRYDIQLPNGEVNYNIELDNMLVKLSPTHNSIGCAWQIENTGNKKTIEIGTRIEMGHKILAKWNWKLYCTVIAVYEIRPPTDKKDLYEVNIDFDEAHAEWTKNKIKGKNGTYRYKK